MGLVWDPVLYCNEVLTLPPLGVEAKRVQIAQELSTNSEFTVVGVSELKHTLSKIPREESDFCLAAHKTELLCA